MARARIKKILFALSPVPEVAYAASPGKGRHTSSTRILPSLCNLSASTIPTPVCQSE
jgi:hypothetical protein